jgi:asparagine synthase (glutamine-hydrolysing)
MQIARNGQVHEEKFFFFDIEQDQEVPPQNIDSYADQLEEALAESIAGRLNSDVPLGAFLSSGVDSSLVCAVLAKRMGREVKTFTVGFDGDAGSEHEPARQIATLLGTEHREYIFKAADFDRVCQDIGRLLDEPNGDRSCVPTYLLSEFTRKHVTVSISGDAGDELFGGYNRYPPFAHAYDKAKDAHPAGLVKSYIEQGLLVTQPEAVQKAFPAGYNAVTAFYFRYAPLFNHLQRPALQALRQFDFHTYLPGAVLAKVDRMSMQHALEVRTPFLSPRVMALSSRASVGVCWAGNVQKVVLRHLLARYLPAALVNAPKKGFGMPGSVFLNNQERVRTELQGAVNRLAGTRFFSERPGALQHLAGSVGANTNSIWATIVLAKWVDSVGRAL